MNNKNKGWVKIYREIRNHWIWKDFEESKRWIDLILMANYEPVKERVHNEIYTIETGHFRTTQTELSKLWNCSRSAVSNFLKLLESDDMINITSNRKIGTIIEIKNYKKYQNIENNTFSGGWIKIYRNISNHWISQDSNSFIWWIDLIMMMNYSNQKVPIEDKVIEVKIGQKFTSQEKLAKRWNCSRKKVANFLKLLEKEGMIKFMTIYRTGTQIEVLNYKVYQDFNHQNKQRSDNGQTRPEQQSDNSQTRPEQPSNKGPTTEAHKEEVKNFKEGVKKQRIPERENNSRDYVAIEYYNANFEKPANRMIVKDLTSYSLIFDDEIIIEALNITLRANQNFNYTLGILDNWKNKNIKTVNDAKNYFKNNKNSKYSSVNKVIKDPLPHWIKDDYVIPNEDDKPSNSKEQNNINESIERLAKMRERLDLKENKIT